MDMPPPPQSGQQNSQDSSGSPSQKKGIGDMFHSKKGPVAAPGPNILDLANEMKDTSRRMRIIEERFLNLRQKTQVIEQNILHHNKQIIAEQKTMNSDIHDIRRDIDSLKTKILLIIKEIKMLSKKEEVQVLENYINMWNPVKFVTKNEVEKLIDERLKELLQEK